MSIYFATILLPLASRLQAFIDLGDFLRALKETDLRTYLAKACETNPWFTKENVQHAFFRVHTLLQEHVLRFWLKKYLLPTTKSKKIGLILAGNIPLVGFYDLLCVLLSGHIAYLKPSRRDDVLMRYITDALCKICPDFAHYIAYPDQLADIDALIATGSSETATHFAKSFGHLPHILRGHRNSVAILRGHEPPDALHLLGEDVFTYFGLGCRSVSKLYVPESYDLRTLGAHWGAHYRLLNCKRYANNYLYQRALRLIDGISFIDEGFFLLEKQKSLHSPVGVLHYERYATEEELNGMLVWHGESQQAIYAFQRGGTRDFGTAQRPSLWDYPDGVDTMHFLESVSA